MVTYGPWTQDPDYTKTLGGSGAANIDSHAADHVIVPDARAPADQNTADQVALSSASNFAGVAEEPIGTAAPLGVSYEFRGNPAVGVPWSTAYNAERSYGLVTFSAYSNNLNGWAPTLPPDAIGYEWESGAPAPGIERSTVIRATWDMASTAYNFDTTTNGPAGGLWSTRVLAVQGVTFASMTNEFQQSGDAALSWDQRVVGDLVIELAKAEHLTSRVDTVELTPHMFGPPEAGYIALIREVSGLASFGDLSVPSGGQYTIGSLYNLTYPLTYTFRPPRYRLIYDTPGRRRGTTTPLRLTQRGDGLTGGAPRLLGRNSQQSTNRLSGGYF